MKKKEKTIFVFIFLLIAILICSSIIIFNLTRIDRKTETVSIPLSEKDYCVLITGVSENDTLLKQVFEGATIVSNFYDSAIQYKVPESKTIGSDMQPLFDYAGLVGVDCVITYIGENGFNCKRPEDVSGNPIPLVTIGAKTDSVDYISHIGIDYQKLAKQMADEARTLLKDKGIVYILNTYLDSHEYANIFLSTLQKELRQAQGIVLINSSLNQRNDFSIEDNLRQQVASSGNIDLILSISEQGTVLAAQVLSDLNLTHKTKIIGFGEGADSLAYFEKGIVTEMFCIDGVDIGKKAVKSFFEFTTTGVTERYVNANVTLIK